MNKALFIDRDGTINVDCPYCSKPEQIRIYKDAIDLIKSYKKFGFLIIVISNQSGIGRKLFSEQDVINFNESLNNCLKKFDSGIDKFYFCPHTPEDNCNCRKPKDGLIKRAMSENDIDLIGSIFVGDRDDIDGELARNMSMHYKILKRTGNEKVISYEECLKS
jgi:D,D-heptose 1,7-bisphosphate phosphatase